MVTTWMNDQLSVEVDAVVTNTVTNSSEEIGTTNIFKNLSNPKK